MSDRVRPQSPAGESPDGLRVELLDLFCCVPYYNGYLQRALAAQGVAASLAAVDYHYDPGYFDRCGVARERGAVEWISRLQLPWASIRRPLRLAELAANMLATIRRWSRRPPQVVHIQYLALAERGIGIEVRMLEWLRRRGIPIVYTVHNVLPQSSGTRLHELYQHIYRMADRLICHSASAYEELLDTFDLDPARVVVIPHGPLFHDEVKPVRSEARRYLDVRDDQVVVLCHGGIKPYKGVDILLEAWRRIEGDHPDAELLIAGPGESGYLQSIRELAGQLGLDHRVRLDFRFAPASELPLFFEGADILAYPYREITSSGALMTGLSFDKAVLASGLPAFRELLAHEENAWLVTPGDPGALAEGLSRLLSDSALCARLAAGVAARRTADSDQGWQAVARATLACYRDALAQSGTGPNLAHPRPQPSTPASPDLVQQ